MKKYKEDMKKDKAWTKKNCLCWVLSLNLEAKKDAEKDAKSCKSHIYLLNKYFIGTLPGSSAAQGFGNT